MPFKTKKYLLECFLDGDLYSSVADKRRFSTIDNQLWRASEISGDGVIDGWEVSDNGFPEIKISKGSGIIDGFYVNTYNDQVFNLEQNITYYVFSQKREGIVGIDGPKSDIESIIITDETSPTQISISTINSDGPFSVILTWDIIQEIDVSHYDIERSTDGANYILIDSVNKIYNQYTDETEENTTYYYHIYVVDSSGNRSDPIGLVITTPADTSLPPDVFGLSIIPSESAVNILWDRPIGIEFDKIKEYKITLYKLDTDSSVLEISTTLVNKNLYYERIGELINGQLYKLKIQTIDINNNESVGINQNFIPQPSNAPRDPEGIAYSFESISNGVKLLLSWSDGDTPYDPATTYRYKIYVSVDNRESLAIDVPIGFSEEQISLFTYDLNNYNYIPENSLVVVKITALDRSGFESKGNYIKFKTPIFHLPNPVRNVNVEFNSNNANLDISWDNNIDTDYIELELLINNPEDEYGGITTFSDSIGRTERYKFFNIQLGYSYIVRITAYNEDNIPSSTYETTIQIISSEDLDLPEFPTDIETHVNDKQITLLWKKSSSIYTGFYNIYKKEGEVSLEYTEWNLVNTLNSNQLSYTDYGLQNNQIYSYYITSVDIYGRESLHLVDDAYNLNFVEVEPKSQSILTAPDNIHLQFISNSVILTWDSLQEEFDSFSVYRSIDNKSNFELLTTLPKNVLSYTDSDIPLVDGTVLFYIVGKSSNDSQFEIQISNVEPENSILISKVTTGTSLMVIDNSVRRIIKDMHDPIVEYAQPYILNHKHKELAAQDSTRIQLSSKIIIDNWETVDGRTWTTNDIIEGSDFILKINGLFPSVFYEVYPSDGQIVFSEAIVEIDTLGEIIGDIPLIQLEILDISEVTGELNNSRVKDIHAKQIQFSRFNVEQIPSINHEGRINENLISDKFLLERVNNHQFIVPQRNTDTSKNFGNGTTFFSISDFKGGFSELLNQSLYDNGEQVVFRNPGFSIETQNNLAEKSQNIFMSSSLNEYRFNNNIYVATSALELVSLNYSTLASSVIASLSLFSTPDAIVVDILNGVAYTANKVGATSLRISEIDLYTGSVFEQHFILISALETLFSMAIYEGQLYVNIWNSLLTTNTLKTINLDDSTITTIGGMDTYEFGPVSKISLTFNGPILYGMTNHSTTGKLLTINKTTGITTVVGPTGVSVAITSIATDISGLNIFGISSSNLYRISTSTGVATLIGAHGVTSPKSIFLPLESNNHIYSLRNTDTSKSGYNKLRMGNFYNFNGTIYIKFQIEENNTILSSSLNFGLSEDIGTDIYLDVSIIDPSLYDYDIDFDDISSYNQSKPVVSNIVPGPGFTSIDVTDLIEYFMSNNFKENKYIIFSISTNSLTQENNVRSIDVIDETIYLNINSLDDNSSINTADLEELSYKMRFEFVDNDPSRWVRVSTKSTYNYPNPVLDLNNKLYFKILNPQSSIYLSLGIREISGDHLTLGSDGGTTGPIEWVGVQEVNNGIPKGLLIEKSSDWQEVVFDLKSETVISDSGGDSILNSNFGVLESFAFTINSDDDQSTEEMRIYIQDMYQFNNTLVSGTSQGILVSNDFGHSWNLSRYSATPTHKFLTAQNNKYIWAISSTEAFLSTDPNFWFNLSGLTGVQNIRDISEDSEGNMYVSSDKGVYIIKILSLTNFARFVQTSPINAIVNDCYGLYQQTDSSGLNSVLVSTEIGIYKTSDYGDTWTLVYDTFGFPVYKFLNIGSSSPIIVGITKKHLLLLRNGSFEIIYNLSNEIGVSELWDIEFFRDKFYISTDLGTYVSNTIDVNNIEITTLDKNIAVLEKDNYTGISFFVTKLLQSTTTEDILFIGQENKLITINENNTGYIKKEYINKELPSFFDGDSEIPIGYTYNAFNNVLSFRNPQEFGKLIYASYLPRKKFFAANKGWAQTNIESDIAIYKNGIPTWLDWKLDSNSIIDNLNEIKEKINSLPEFNDFNSKVPDANNYKSLVVSNIDNMLLDNNNLTSKNIRDFIDNYSRFLSLLDKSVKSFIVDGNVISLLPPEFVITGDLPENRKTNSRAESIEMKYDIKAESSININIDTVSGKFDFNNAYINTTDINRKNLLSFSKFDKLKTSIFNSNIINAGTNSHGELEEILESVNTGLTSDLASNLYGNLIKSGTFLESQHAGFFDIYNTSRLQSKFNVASTQDWYDILNSTIDYDKILAEPNPTVPNYFTCFSLVDTEYNQTIWVGTDTNIYVYEISSGNIVLDSVINIENSNLYIWDIYVFDNIIYVIAESGKKSKIWSSSDFGSTWEQLQTLGAPDQIYSFKIINGNYIITTDSGIFYSNNQFGQWYQSELVVSTAISSDSITNNFSKTFFNITLDNFIIAESNNNFYRSNNGIVFYGNGEITSGIINKIARYKNITYIATNIGIFNDANSVFSDKMSFSLEKIEDTTIDSSISVNDIAQSDEELYCCARNGYVYRLYNSVWSKYKVPDFDTAHKIVLIQELAITYLIVFSYNQMKLIDVTNGSGVFDV